MTMFRGNYGSTVTADPSQLPLAESGANSVLPNTATVAGLQSALAAGATYTDPYSGLTVVRLTSNSSPGAGSWEPSYAEGGPSCSQPWTSGGHTFYTILVRDSTGAEKLVDIQYDLIGVSDPRSNIRSITVSGEIGIAFSLTPATPRIAYVLNSGTKTINRYDTSTNANANIGNWPWVIAAAGTTVDWLFTQLNDTYLGAFLNSNSTIVAWKPATGVEISLPTSRQLSTVANEYRMDREDPYIYSDTGAGNTARPVWKLLDDTVFNAVDYDLTPHIINWEHGAALRGGVAGLAADQVLDTDKGAFVFRADTLATSNFITTASGIHGASTDGYFTGHWCMDLRSTDRAAQWCIADSFGGDTAGAKVRQNMIAWVNTGSGEVRLVAASGSNAAVYDTFPQPFTSPDGKLLFWTSDMNNSGRWDAFMAKMPVS